MAGDPHPVADITGITTSADVSKTAFIAFVKARTILLMENAAEIQADDLSGQLQVALLSTGRIYALDTGDTTTLDDGVNCIRDANGLGFFLQAIAGVDGADGAAATIAVGTVDSVPNGDPATVTNSGTSSAAVLDFEIPIGDTGATGPTGPAAWLAPVAWLTLTAYVVGPPASVVTEGGETYVCIVGHTSGTFATDLAAAKWIKVAAAGADGDVPEARALTAGAGLAGGGDLSTDRSFAVGAGTGIVVNADDVAIDKATDANVRAATSNKVVTSDLVESASAAVALTETAGAVAVDWDAFINGTVTVDEATVISNPTNGQPGTWRSILVQGNDGTDRTITFGNQFLGDVPTITDCDSAKWYLLMIYCVSATHFVVSSKVAKT